VKDKKMLADFRMSKHSGIGVYLRNVLNYLDQKSTFTISLAAGPESSIETELNLQSPIYSIKEQLEYFLKIRKVDLFWSPHYNIPVLPIRAVKRVVTIHDVYHLAFSNTLTPFQKIYAKIMINLAVRLSDAVITVSEFSKQEIVRYTNCDTKRIHVISNGVKQATVLLDYKSIREKYHIPAGPYILFVGNVKPHKNLITLLKAFRQLPEELYRNYQVVIVGKREGMITGDAGVFALIEEDKELSKKVVFTGIVDDEDLDTIYANASLFAFPSHYEGFGLPPLEAMVNGCPVISSNSSSLPEVCGDAVLYFDPVDVNALEKAIASVLMDKELARSLITKGYERVKQFTWEKSGQSHNDLFEKLIKEK
jgi:glycosyltransferase involved in cell wall biosynthesis